MLLQQPCKQTGQPDASCTTYVQLILRKTCIVTMQETTKARQKERKHKQRKKENLPVQQVAQ